MLGLRDRWKFILAPGSIAHWRVFLVAIEIGKARVHTLNLFSRLFVSEWLRFVGSNCRSTKAAGIALDLAEAVKILFP